MSCEYIKYELPESISSMAPMEGGIIVTFVLRGFGKITIPEIAITYFGNNPI